MSETCCSSWSLILHSIVCSLNRTANLGKDVACIGTHQVHDSHDKNENDRNHDRVFSNILAILGSQWGLLHGFVALSLRGLRTKRNGTDVGPRAWDKQVN